MSDQEDPEEQEETTFQIGDYKNFLSNTCKILFSLFILLTIGFHVLYYSRHNIDEFMNEYFPTDENKSPFCHAKDHECDRSIWYRDTTVEVNKVINGTHKMVTEPYNPEFNIDIVKQTTIPSNKISIKGTYDNEYWYWLFYWWNNTFMKMNIYNNQIFKSIFKFIHDSVSENKQGFISKMMTILIVYGGWIFVIATFKILMPLITIGTFIYAGCTAYDKHSWILMFPSIGAIYLMLSHISKGNSFQALISFCGIGFGCILHFLIGCGIVGAMFLPIIKLVRIYGLNLVMMLFHISELIWSKLNNLTLDTPLDNPTMDDKYIKMISYFSEFSTGIFFIISVSVLVLAFKYLSRGISIGMTLCSIYLIFSSYFSKKE